MAGMLARKIEMTRVIKNDKFVPITLLEIPSMQVLGYKTQEKDGYSAMIVGISGETEAKLKKGKKALSARDFSVVKEFTIQPAEENEKAVGATIGFTDLEWVESVGITWVSKGRGFAGAMKRHNFHGGPAGHGSKFHRALGSIGNRKPTRTHKGKKMHGHYGVDQVSLRSVPLELVNENAGIIGVRGPVPGGRHSLVQLFF